MKKAEKVRRNQPCPCGSGRKFKRCCELKRGELSRGARLGLVALLCALLGAILLGIASFRSSTDFATPGRVWSDEHGHWHTVQ